MTNKPSFGQIIHCLGVKFPDDDVSYLYPTWDKMGDYCFLLAKKIISANGKFDRLVTLAKGGWSWARNMADLLAIDKVASIQLELYSDVYKTIKEPIILQSLPVSIIGEELIVFDDVVDSGKTLPFCQRYLKMCGARKITMATLFYKPWSVYRPDFFVCQTKAWIIFPHEVRETIDEVSQKWLKLGLTKAEIAKRFAKIGLPRDQVEYYLKLAHLSLRTK